MMQKWKITLGLAFGVGLVSIYISTALSPSWKSSLSHWPQVPPTELYVTNKPKLEDVQGTYQITQQNITTNGLAVLQGRLCLLDLRPDGSFTLTNYPDLSSTAPFFLGFISTTGRWHFDTLGSFGNNQKFWGIEFSDASVRLEPLALRLQGNPYNLMLTYGDGDDGTVMTFGKANETTGLKDH